MNLLTHFKPIRMIVMDVDGVLTDGTVYLIRDQEQARAMNIKDGYALQLAVKKGYHVAVISGAFDQGVEYRLKKLGLTEIHLAVIDKAKVLKSLATKYQLQPEAILFIGDDIPDLSALEYAGLACCPADAVSEVKAIVNYISPHAGGKGCVRDIIEKVLKLNGHWDVQQGIAAI